MIVPVIGPHPPADPQARLTSHLPFEFTFALALSVALLRSGQVVFFGGRGVGLSVGFRVDVGVGADEFVGGTKVGFAVGLDVGVDVEVSVSAEVDSVAGVADGLSEVGVSLGLAAAVNSPSITRVAATAVPISSNERSAGVGVSVGSTRSGRLQAARINATPKIAQYRNRFPPDMSPILI